MISRLMTLRRSRVPGLFACVLLACPVALAAPAAPPPTRIVHVNVVTLDDDGHVYPDGSVLIQDGRIVPRGLSLPRPTSRNRRCVGRRMERRARVPGRR